MSKKPSHDLPDTDAPDHDRPEGPGHPGHPAQPDHDLPRRRPGAHPDQELPDPDSGAAPKHVGRVHFEDVSGGDNGSAIYAVPAALRDRVLVWRYKQHEQNHVNDQGEWVYRQTHTAATGSLERDAALTPIEETETPAPIKDIHA